MTPHHITSHRQKKTHRRTRNPHIISQSSSTHTSDTVKEGIIATVNNLQVQLVSRGKQSGSLLDLSVLLMKFFFKTSPTPCCASSSLPRSGETSPHLLSKLVIDVTTESLPWPNFELASRVVFFFTERAQREINSLQKNVAAAVILTPCDAPELGEKHTRGFQAVLGADGTGEGRNFGHAWGPKFTPDAILGLKPPDSGRYEPGRRWVRGKNGEANGAPGRPGRGSESSRVRWLWRGYGGSSLSLPFVPSLPSFLPSLQAALLPSFSLSFPSHLRMRSSPFILLSSKYSASHPLPDTNRSPSNDSSTIRMYRCRLDGWMNSRLFPFSFKPTVHVPHHA